jgi:hypothetical protein
MAKSLRPIQKVSPKGFAPKTLPKLAAKANAVPDAKLPIPTQVNKKRAASNRNF